MISVCKVINKGNEKIPKNPITQIFRDVRDISGITQG